MKSPLQEDQLKGIIVRFYFEVALRKWHEVSTCSTSCIKILCTGTGRSCTRSDKPESIGSTSYHIIGDL